MLTAVLGRRGLLSLRLIAPSLIILSLIVLGPGGVTAADRTPPPVAGAVRAVSVPLLVPVLWRPILLSWILLHPVLRRSIRLSSVLRHPVLRRSVLLRSVLLIRGGRRLDASRIGDGGNRPL